MYIVFIDSFIFIINRIVNDHLSIYTRYCILYNYQYDIYSLKILCQLPDSFSSMQRIKKYIYFFMFRYFFYSNFFNINSKYYV